MAPLSKISTSLGAASAAAEMAAGLVKIGGYITHHHNSVAQYIDMRKCFDIAMSKEKRPGSPATMRWWKHEGVWFGNDKRGTE